MNFDFDSRNILLVDSLVEQFYLENIFECIKSKLTTSFKFSNYDLVPMIKLKENIQIYNDLTENNNVNKFKTNGALFFEEMTNEVLEYKLGNTQRIHISDLYNLHLSKLYTIKDLYGIVGVDEELNEVINFTHPFRAISNIKTKQWFSLNKLFIYKKKPKLFKTTKEEDKIQIKSYINLYCSMYEKGFEFKSNKETSDKSKYISFDYCEEINSIALLIDKKVNNSNKASTNSFLYYSDILLFNSFMPYYAIFNLKVNKSSLVGTPLKFVPCLSPNISTHKVVCTGSLPNISEEGIKSLKYSNLGSPFNQRIIDRTLLDYYVTYCIAYSKVTYEKGLTNEQD